MLEQLPLPGGTAPADVARSWAVVRTLIAQHSRPGPHADRLVLLPHDPGHPPRPLARPPRPGMDVLIATSGSATGHPRLVGLSTEALVASARATERALDGPGRWILALPSHHVAGFQVIFRSALAGAQPIVIDTSRGFDPRALSVPVREATSGQPAPVYLSLVPTQLAAVLDAPGVAPSLARLAAILVGGSGITPDLLRRARDAGLRVVTTYGMTETCGGCVYDGAPLAGVRVRERAERLLIAGPVLMEGYVGAGEAEDPFDVDPDGTRWLRTGDLGRVRGGGARARVQVLGRADDVIVSGGLSIAPEPVREAVQAVPGVDRAEILSLPDPRWGQVVCAAVVRRDRVGPRMPGGDLGALAHLIRDRVGERLGRASAPRVVVAVDAIPMLPSGKVDRTGLRTRVRGLLGTSAEWRR